MAQSGLQSHFALRRIAAAHRPTTIVAAKAALREAGIPLKLAHNLLQATELLSKLRAHAKKEPQPEARAAVLHALRRARALRLAA